MAVINDSTVSTNVTRVGEVATGATGALHVTPRPIPSSVGHFRFAYRTIATTAQAANSRLLEIRNTHATNLLIPTRILMRVAQIAAGTAQETSLDIFKCTAFSALDTTSTTTITASPKRTSMTAHTSNGADIRGLVATGAAAGMTGGTLTKDATAWTTFPHWVATTVITGATGVWVQDALDDTFGSYPWVFIQNEGLEVENRVLNATSDGLGYYFDVAFAIATAY